MEDISDTIGRLLQDPETMKQIMSLKDLLMSDETKQNFPEEHTIPKQETKNDLPMVQDDTFKTIMKFIPLISDVRKDDDTTRLLRALRPFLSEPRRSKLDEATKILQLMKLLPIIRQLNF